MPKKLEKALKKAAKKLKLKGERKNAFIFGNLRKTGWKPTKKK
jgi:hypothetical protein